MRLIGIIEDEQKALSFYAFLQREGIECSCEQYFDAKNNKTLYKIWISDEDQFQIAQEAFEHFKANQADPRYGMPEKPLFEAKHDDLHVHVILKSKNTILSFALTYFILIVCAVLFFWSGMQESQIRKAQGELAGEVTLTPIQKDLFFDYPKAFKKFEEEISNYPLHSYKELKDLPPQGQALLAQMETLPYWRGVFTMISEWKTRGISYVRSIPLFEKIREGEVWRLFTPCLLHGNFLHILFNMAWVWFLGKQIEERLSRTRMVVLLLLIGILSNIAQYLIGGFLFLGFSGIVIGMVGFIWMRQKKAPWEGYPLHRSVVFFIVAYVLALFVLEIASLGLKLFFVSNLSSNIGNTAHIIGGLTGIALGKLSFFRRNHRVAS